MMRMSTVFLPSVIFIMFYSFACLFGILCFMVPLYTRVCVKSIEN
nr:MAG TPA: hypothetical protein [Caudoviricetes sp.]